MRFRSIILYRPFVISGVLAILLISTLIIVQQQTRFWNRAANQPHPPVVRGLAGDGWADTVIGKIDFHQAGENSVVPYKVFNPGGVIIDRSVRPNKLYIYDGANNRILGYKSLGVCSDNVNQACTANSDCTSNLCDISAKKDADIVFGQPSLTGYSACNIVDGNMELFPYRKPASASTLCTVPPSQNSFAEGGSHASLAVDNQGNLYVPDYHNNRVLKYNDPFSTDTVADNVWGQTDFSGFRCNVTDVDYTIESFANIPNPTNNSLCFGRNTKYQSDSFMAGVDIDKNGALWVADTLNNRVVRFPNNSKTADLVLGQNSFTTRTYGGNMNQLNSPAVVRIHPDTNEVYVADYNNNRILVFTPPFTNGMAANRTFGSNIKGPGGIEFDPDGEGVWIADHLNNMTELWNSAGTVVIKVLQKDTYQPNSICGSTSPYKTCINPRPNGECWENLCSHRGSIGIDSDKNLYISSTSFSQDVYRYAYPIPTPQEGKLYSAEKRIMYPPGGSTNLTDKYGLYYTQGIAVTNDQLIASDDKRILFWNDPKSLTNGKPADGAIGNMNELNKQGYLRLANDSIGNLYAVHRTSIEIFTLPLTNGEQPMKTLIQPGTTLPVLGGGSITFSDNRQYWGIDISPDGKYFWITDVADDIHRVLRIRDPLSNPIIDVILGQANLDSAHCNRNPLLNSYHSQSDAYGAQANTVCKPGAVTIDTLGNIWISDYALEFHGNRRILMFKKEQFENLSTALYGPNADIVSKEIRAWEMAFDSQNRMIVGIDGQLSPPGYPQLYQQPTITLNQTVSPDSTLYDFFSHGFASVFDADDNLYIGDLNRGRILFYKKPFAAIPTATPSPTTVTIVPSSTPTNVPGPLAWWKLNEGSGTSTTDASVYKNNATLVNSPLWVSGKFGYAVEFGKNEAYVLSNNDLKFANKSFSIGAWVKRTKNASSGVTYSIALSQGTPLSNAGLHIGFVSDKIRCGFWGNDLDSPSTYPDISTWNHIACSYDATTNTRKIYYNGVLVVTQNNVSADYSGSGKFKLGGWAWNTNEEFAGSIDNAFIYDYVRTPEQLKEDMNRLDSYPTFPPSPTMSGPYP